MKLQTRYNYVNLVTTVIVLLITGLVYYQAISWILTWQKDKDLIDEEQEIFQYVSLNHQLPQTFETNDQQISFTAAAPGSVQRTFINTVYFKSAIKHQITILVIKSKWNFYLLRFTLNA